MQIPDFSSGIMPSCKLSSLSYCSWKYAVIHSCFATRIFHTEQWRSTRQFASRQIESEKSGICIYTYTLWCHVKKKNPLGWAARFLAEVGESRKARQSWYELKGDLSTSEKRGKTANFLMVIFLHSRALKTWRMAFFSPTVLLSRLSKCLPLIFCERCSLERTKLATGNPPMALPVIPYLHGYLHVSFIIILYHRYN